MNISMEISIKKTLEPIPSNLDSLFDFSMVMTSKGVRSKTRDTYDIYVWYVLYFPLWLALYQAYEWVWLVKMCAWKSDILVHEEDECLVGANKIQWIPYDHRRRMIKVVANLEWTMLSYGVKSHFEGFWGLMGLLLE